jgi:putative CRISPR-associated protein (TIGR02620 family)
MSILIVTRHAGLIEWLKRHGVGGDVIEVASPADVAGRDVIGVLPLHLAALARSVTTVDMPGLTLAQRGKDLSPDEMDAAGAMLHRYIVREDK